MSIMYASSRRRRSNTVSTDRFGVFDGDDAGAEDTAEDATDSTDDDNDKDADNAEDGETAVA